MNPERNFHIPFDGKWGRIESWADRQEAAATMHEVVHVLMEMHIEAVQGAMEDGYIESLDLPGYSTLGGVPLSVRAVRLYDGTLNHEFSALSLERAGEGESPKRVAYLCGPDGAVWCRDPHQSGNGETEESVAPAMRLVKPQEMYDIRDVLLREE